MSYLVDFNQPLGKIKYTIYHLTDNLVNSHQEVLIDIYRGLIQLRHDLLHYFCHKSMGVKWEKEKKLNDIFSFELPLNFKNKTPDTVFVDENEKDIIIIDYSVSVDTHTLSKIKMDKYMPITIYCESIGYKCRFIHINVRSDFQNLDAELTKIDNLMKYDFDHSDFLELCNALENHKEIVSKQIDPIALEEQKRKYYGNLEDEDEFLESSIGTFSDLDINIEGFKKYNSQFSHDKLIEKSIGACVIEELEEELKKIIENPNDPIYAKYSDKKLDEEQFKKAAEEIYHRNRCAPMTKTRPSHHMLIPMPTDIEMKTGPLSEQDSILRFSSDYLEFYNKEKKRATHDKFALIGVLFETINRNLKGSDASVYRTLFHEEETEYTPYIEEFKKLKKMRTYLSSFYTHGKYCGSSFKKTLKYIHDNNYTLPKDLPVVRFNQRELAELGLEISKDDIRALWEYFVVVLQRTDDFPKGGLGDYLYHRKVLKENPGETVGWIIGNKKVKLPLEKQPQLVKIAFNKGGINIDVGKKDRSPKQDRGTIDIFKKEIMDSLIDYMATGNHDPKGYKIYDFLTTTPSRFDTDQANKMKVDSVEHIKIYLKKIMQTNGFRYSYFCQLAYNQLFHINEYKSNNDTVCVFNLGIENFCCIVALTNTQKEGKPFLSIIKTKTPDLYTEFWGKTYKMKAENDYYYVATNWRRLDSNKITFLRDVHFQVLSSTMNSAMSSPNAHLFAIGNKLAELYTFRMLISYSSNQKTGELLLDTRYAYMSAISWYTDLGKLLVEKFGYQFNTIIEAWIIHRLITKFPQINKAVRDGGITNYRITLDGQMRDIQSIGGKIRIPSLWHNYDLTDITELLDEAFVYVHTTKEPSNIFHEQVKAIQTIIKFQKEYDELPLEIKTGCIDNPRSMRNFLLNNSYVGCCAPIIYNSVTRTTQKENPNYKKITHNITDESIGEIISTKAVISDPDRKVVRDRKMNNRDIKKEIKRQEVVTGKMEEKLKNEYVLFRLQTNSRFYSDYKPRQKVWETILDYLENDPKLCRTVQLAEKFLENPTVVADICIKSQYGSKREFYVINITAKAMARVTENFFRKLSENSPNEAISIPGDRKVMAMQTMLDRVHSHHKDETHEIIYTNGDCTKWSAAETMQSFIAMAMALKDKIPVGLYNVIMATFNAWSDKKIQIPMDVYNKVIPSEKYNTNYITELKKISSPCIRSTQNFLQGMFNYSSSYKAVCCSNYTYMLWKKFYPNSNLKIEHLEHSDDYVTVCMYSNITEFERYRVLHKMMMRLHGYNDSERKTCSQPYIMEFVSQMSHNGVMLYPQIKKSKEVNLSLPCTGYTKDMEAALSRVGECSRVGCNLCFLYFFQRLHVYIVAEAYAVLPGMRNNMSRCLSKLFEEPIELFGIPDVLPLFSSYCRGNANNYRLYKYGNEKTKSLLRYLYKKALYVADKEKIMVEGEDDRYCLATPRFLYDMGNRSIMKLKKEIGLTPQEINLFWETHPIYKIMKPKTNEKLLMWVKTMFYNRSFMEAYSKTNRAKMTLRIPQYVSKNMISEMVTIEDHFKKQYNKTNYHTIKTYYEKIKKESKIRQQWEHKDEVHLNRIITKCDPTISEIYSFLQNVTITITDVTRKQTIQVACRQPQKTTTITIVNQPQIVLQYILDKEMFIKDNRRVKSRLSLEKDVLLVQDKYGDELRNKNNTMALLSIYNDLMINKKQQNIFYTYDRRCHHLKDFLTASLRHNYHPGFVCKVTSTDVGEIEDPTTMKLLYYKDRRLTKDFFRQCLDNICLIHVFLSVVLSMSRPKIIEILSQIRFDMQTGFKMNYIEVIKNIGDEYLSSNNFSPSERKISAYLREYYLNDMTQLIDLVNNNYTFSYKYNQRAIKQGDNYIGETIVTFSHFNTMVKAYHNEKYGRPIMLVQKHYPSISPSLYNIALRLTSCLSQREYDDEPKTDRRKLILGEELKVLLNHLSVDGGCSVVKPGKNEFDTIIKPWDINPEEFYYPILITKKTILREGGHHYSKQIAVPHIENEHLTVKMGKFKLFVLPYWKCHQFNNMECSNVFVDDVDLNHLLQNRRLENILMSPQNLRYDKIEIPEIETPKLYKKITDHINEQKIYSLKFSSLTNAKGHWVDILNSIGVEKIDGSFIKSVEKLPVETIIPDIHDKETVINLTTPASQAQPEKNFMSDDFLVFDEDYNDVPGTEFGWDEEMDYGTTETEMTHPTELQEDFELRDEFSTDFKIDTVESCLPTDTFADDLMDDTEGLNYHIREYVGNDVYHREIFGKKMDDKFLIDPKTNTRNKDHKKLEFEFYSNMGSNYMVLRLKKIPKPYITLLFSKYCVQTTPDIMNIYSLVGSIRQTIELLEYINKTPTKQSSHLAVLLTLEKLLCRTYITDLHNHKQEVGFAYDKENNIYLGIWVNTKGKLTMERIIENTKQGKLLGNEGKDYVLVKTTIERFLEHVSSKLSLNILTQQKPMVTPQLDDLYRKLAMEMNENTADDLLNDIY